MSSARRRTHLDQISDALISGTTCFLDNDAWLVADVEANHLPEMMFRCHVKLPGLLHDLQNMSSDHCLSQSVLNEALALREEMLYCFHHWINSKGSLDTFPSRHTTSDSLHTHTYEFPELQSLILYCSHYANLIIINKIIIDCWKEHPLNIAYECHQAAAEIAACVDQAQSSLLTSMSLQLWLQAAVHGCSEIDARWFARKMSDLGLVR